MYENNTRRRPHLEDTYFESKDSQKGKSSFICFQIVVCVLCLAAALVIKQFGGAYYVTARAYVKDAFQNNVTSSQISEVFSSIRNQFPDAAEVFSNDFTSSLSENDSKNISSAVSDVQGSSASSGTSSETAASEKTESSSSSPLSEQTSVTAAINLQ